MCNWNGIQDRGTEIIQVHVLTVFMQEDQHMRFLANTSRCSCIWAYELQLQEEFPFKIQVEDAVWRRDFSHKGLVYVCHKRKHEQNWEEFYPNRAHSAVTGCRLNVLSDSLCLWCFPWAPVVPTSSFVTNPADHRSKYRTCATLMEYSSNQCWQLTLLWNTPWDIYPRKSVQNWWSHWQHSASCHESIQAENQMEEHSDSQISNADNTEKQTKNKNFPKNDTEYKECSISVANTCILTRLFFDDGS